MRTCVCVCARVYIYMKITSMLYWNFLSIRVARLTILNRYFWLFKNINWYKDCTKALSYSYSQDNILQMLSNGFHCDGSGSIHHKHLYILLYWTKLWGNFTHHCSYRQLYVSLSGRDKLALSSVNYSSIFKSIKIRNRWPLGSRKPIPCCRRHPLPWRRSHDRTLERMSTLRLRLWFKMLTLPIAEK